MCIHWLTWKLETFWFPLRIGQMCNLWGLVVAEYQWHHLRLPIISLKIKCHTAGKSDNAGCGVHQSYNTVTSSSDILKLLVLFWFYMLSHHTKVYLSIWGLGSECSHQMKKKTSWVQAVNGLTRMSSFSRIITNTTILHLEKAPCPICCCPAVYILFIFKFWTDTGQPAWKSYQYCINMR